jgi:murein DD-endopeptidase MepM/ murein hydrolase activator NlpD
MRPRTVIGLAIAAVALTSRSRVLPSGAGWYWPVPSVRLSDGRVLPAVATHEFEVGHNGLDIGFRDGGKYVAPAGTPITAARAGVVQRAFRSPRGWSVVLVHEHPWATFYQHLDSIAALAAGMRVGATQRLGVMGIDPLDGERVRHLHFEVWEDWRAIDVGTVIGRWERPGIWSVSR